MRVVPGTFWVLLDEEELQAVMCDYAMLCSASLIEFTLNRDLAALKD